MKIIENANSAVIKCYQALVHQFSELYPHMNIRILKAGFILSILLLQSCRISECPSQRQQITERFEGFENIENVSVSGYDDTGYCVMTELSFSIVGRPDTVVVILPDYDDLIDCHYETTLESLYIIQIGKYQFSADGTHYFVDYEGQPSSYRFKSEYIELGTQGDFRDRVSVRIESIRDLVENYDLLTTDLSNWPRENHPAQLVTKNGEDVMDYFVIDSTEAEQQDSTTEIVVDQGQNNETCE